MVTLEMEPSESVALVLAWIVRSLVREADNKMLGGLSPATLVTGAEKKLRMLGFPTAFTYRETGDGRLN
jgi:hypothetical protein